MDGIAQFLIKDESTADCAFISNGYAEVRLIASVIPFITIDSFNKDESGNIKQTPVFYQEIHVSYSQKLNFLEYDEILSKKEIKGFRTVFEYSESCIQSGKPPKQLEDDWHEAQKLFPLKDKSIRFSCETKSKQEKYKKLCDQIINTIEF